MENPGAHFLKARHLSKGFMDTAQTTKAELDVLIVDDLADFADSMVVLLEMMGFTAAVSYDAEQALGVVRDRKPLCVLLDVNMPGMDGLDFARALRRECGDSVILIAVSGAAPDDERASATFDLVDHHFVKPLDFAALEKILRA